MGVDTSGVGVDTSGVGVDTSGVGVDSKINPSDCVDMNCDAQKKALVVDADCVC